MRIKRQKQVSMEEARKDPTNDFRFADFREIIRKNRSSNDYCRKGVEKDGRKNNR